MRVDLAGSIDGVAAAAAVRADDERAVPLRGHADHEPLVDGLAVDVEGDQALELRCRPLTAVSAVAGERRLRDRAATRRNDDQDAC